jgi:hypothetical protein
MFFDSSTPKRQKRSGNYKPILSQAAIPAPQPYALLTDHDLKQRRTLVFDTESFKNYWLAGFKCIESNKSVFFELSPDAPTLDRAKMQYVMQRNLIVGFNSNTYDIPIMQLALLGKSANELNEISHHIIKNNLRPYDIRKEYGLAHLPLDHIDLIEVAPITASLKIYAGRLHCPRMQDLPYSPDIALTFEQAEVVRGYHINDLDNTQLLYENLKPQISLRESLGKEYGQDLRSKSDAQIAEAVIGSELEKISPHWGRAGISKAKPGPGWQFQYKVPEWLTFKTPQLQAVLEVVREATFTVGDGGKADVPDAISDLRIALGGCVYRMGGGGLHSSEEMAGHVSTAETLLIDRDVASYYPAIILNQGLYPVHLGEAFLKVFREIVNRRLKAKLDKNKVADQGLKITINGTFGKLGNVYSRMYAPDLLMQVTISGQLCLLMLIEMIELAGIPVISANTDGVVSAVPVERYADFEKVIHTWEDITNFNTEETRYKGLWARDVNNYFALKLDGEIKTKGVYSDKGSALNSPLSKNPECQIISDAVQALLAHNVPLRETIYNCTDIRKFVAVRTVKGGAEKNGVYLGKAIRWYYAEGETGTINYVVSGNNVPKSEGAKPLMTLPPELPIDLDFAYYLKQANETLFDIGYAKRVKEARLF